MLLAAPAFAWERVGSLRSFGLAPLVSPDLARAPAGTHHVATWHGRGPHTSVPGHRSPPLHMTSSSASPKREALGCPPVATRLSHAPACPIVARLWSAHWRSSAAGRFPHTGVAITTSWLCCPTREVRCPQSSIAKRPVSALASALAPAKSGTPGTYPEDPPPPPPCGVAAPPTLGIVHLSPGHAPHALPFSQPP
jgi:hypothetical protein